MDRHARQALLAGVGAEGQARIERASVDIPLDGFAADVAARYLAGAGVGRVRVRAAELAEGARAIDAGVRVDVDPSLGLTTTEHVDLDDAGARDLARGALCALRAIRAALERPS
jgi:molybdopterin/thiamine biosynthesis adenylyltransferase